MSGFFKRLGEMMGDDSSKKSVEDAGIGSVPSPAQEEPDVATSVSIASTEKEDFRLLLSLFKQHKGDGELDVAAFVKEVHPGATPHQCPYCMTVHEFIASRARKCPACSKKMVVRQGLFVTEDQVDEIEKKIQLFYTRQDAVNRLKYALESAQDYKVRKQRVEHIKALADSFRYMAQIENQKDARGLDFWDKAWGYYNRARMEEMENLNKGGFSYTDLPDISWQMAQMLFDQSQNVSKKERAERIRRQALTQAYMALAEAARLEADPYFLTDLYTFAQSRIAELGIADDEIQKMAEDVSSRLHLTGAKYEQYRKWVEELREYEVL